jgi:uncharacterized FlgJ-related protein
MKTDEKFRKLIDKLKSRDNKACMFFEQLMIELNEHSQRQEAVKKLCSCFSITQYADFTPEEEKLLSEIIAEYNRSEQEIAKSPQQELRGDGKS